MKERNIVTNILLSIVTCGIYGLVWFVTITDDAAEASGDSSPTGGMALLLTIVTCGIYGIYWYYMIGKKLYNAKVNRGMNASNNSILYLILGLFGLGIVNYCLMQSEINDIVSNEQ